MRIRRSIARSSIAIIRMCSIADDDDDDVQGYSEAVLHLHRDGDPDNLRYRFGPKFGSD